MMTNNKKKKAFSPTDALDFAIKCIDENILQINTDGCKAMIASKLEAELPAGQFPKEAVTAMTNKLYRDAQKRRDEIFQEKFTLQRVSPEQLTAIETLISNNAIAIAALIQGNNQDGVVLVPGTDRLVDLIVALTTHSLTSYHPSNWIRYEKKEIFALANLQKLSTAEQEELTQQVHNTFGFDMRVIGSNQPIPCYLIPWLVPPQSTAIANIMCNLDPLKIKISLTTALLNTLKKEEDA